MLLKDSYPLSAIRITLSDMAESSIIETNALCSFIPIFGCMDASTYTVYSGEYEAIFGHWKSCNNRFYHSCSVKLSARQL